jgi:phosphate/sulfate permease
VGAARNHKTMRWHLVESILWTWFMTLPATGLIAYVLRRVLQAFGATA